MVIEWGLAVFCWLVAIANFGLAVNGKGRAMVAIAVGLAVVQTLRAYHWWRRRGEG